MAQNGDIQVANKLFDAFNRRKLDELSKFVAPNATFTNVPFGDTHTGPDGFRKDLQMWLTAFPDGKIDIINQVAANGWVVTEYEGHGTHRGVLEGPSGSLQPTGKSVTMKMCDCTRIQNGKIIEARSYFDVFGLYQQLGIGVTTRPGMEARP